MQKNFHWGALSKYKQELMGVATVWILMSHYLFRWPDSLYVLKRICDYGNAGVEMFLIVSGIGLFYSFSKKPSLKDFYKRRYIRLLIPYVLIAVPFWAWRASIGQGNFWKDVFCISFPSNGTIVLWYIPTIAVFYLCFPLLYWLIYEEQFTKKRISPETKTILLCLVAFLCLSVIKKEMPGIYGNCEIGLTRCIIFLVGCCLGQWVRDEKEIPGYGVLLCACLSTGFLLLRETVSIQGFWYRILYAPFGLAVTVVAAWLLDRKNTHMLKKVMRYCGERSIELYMVHITLRSVYWYYFPQGIPGGRAFVDYLIYLAVTFVLSVVVHFMITKISKLLLRKA